MTCNLRNDLCVSEKDEEFLIIEISREKSKNAILSCSKNTRENIIENIIAAPIGHPIVTVKT